MKTQTQFTIVLSLTIIVICIIDCLMTSLYWQHNAVIHHAARFEANSWGCVSFHWNDDSAQTPFQSHFMQVTK